MKLLTPKILTYKGISGPAIVEQVGGRLVVIPFVTETASTEYEPSPIAILKSTAVDEFLLDDIEHIVGNNPIGEAIKKLDELFRSSRLYHEDSDDCAAEIVCLKSAGCHPRH